jgi:hypothetical protein
VFLSVCESTCHHVFRCTGRCAILKLCVAPARSITNLELSIYPLGAFFLLPTITAIVPRYLFSTSVSLGNTIADALCSFKLI